MRKPKPSVKNPGVSMSAPAIRRASPSASSKAGICSCCSFCLTRRKVENPWKRISPAPATAVETTNRMVQPTPTTLPTSIKNQISTRGMIRNKAKRAGNGLILFGFLLSMGPDFIHSMEDPIHMLVEPMVSTGNHLYFEICGGWPLFKVPADLHRNHLIQLPMEDP